jgi:hypothetical protein
MDHDFVFDSPDLVRLTTHANFLHAKKHGPWSGIGCRRSAVGGQPSAVSRQPKPAVKKR